MGAELVALAIGGTDTALWMRQAMYNILGRPHLEFTDMGAFIQGVKDNTNVSVSRAPHQVPGVQGARYPVQAKVNPHPAPPVPRPLSLLTILSHGSANGPYMGAGEADCLTRGRIAGWRHNIASMRPCFERNASVIFGGCVVGLNPWLLADLSLIWPSVRVTGFTELQKLGSPIYFGSRVTAQNGVLIEGRDTPQGQSFVRHPHIRLSPREINTNMGNTGGHDSD